jgi:uncharacterized NAD(P)/FAD-binding protein YdhS
MKEIAIVGGGCSGSLVAVQLFIHGYQGHVSIIEPRERLAIGLAYSTTFDGHLLNVPAGKMSALPQEPSHFLDWLRNRKWPGAEAGSFAPRKLFGEYLHEVLHQTLSKEAGDRFTHIRAEGVGFEALEGSAGAILKLSNGAMVYADHVVLAHGNPASSSAFSQTRRGLEDRWHVSPWIGDALRVRFAGERILLVGTGLTAVDAVLALQNQEKACRIHMLSRRGILPQVHSPGAVAGAPPILTDRSNVRLMVHELREYIEAARQQDLCWRTIVDALRPVSNEIWHELPLEHKQRFVRHLRPYWDPHRSRMAPSIRERLDGYLTSGALHVIAGRLLEVISDGSSSQARILRKGARETMLEVDRIITCTGVQESYTDSPRPLIRSLMKHGLTQANDLGFGLRTDGQGALLDTQLRPSPVFFTLGPPRRGELFETTAVPEIRAQAEALAIRLTRDQSTQSPKNSVTGCCPPAESIIAV